MFNNILIIFFLLFYFIIPKYLISNYTNININYDNEYNMNLYFYNFKKFYYKMEFLLLEPEIIEKISHHYQDSRKKIPKDLIQSIINKRKIDLSLEQLETILLSMFDIKINSIKSEELDFDLIGLWKKLYNDIILFKNPEPSWFFGNYNYYF